MIVSTRSCNRVKRESRDLSLSSSSSSSSRQVRCPSSGPCHCSNDDPRNTTIGTNEKEAKKKKKSSGRARWYVRVRCNLLLWCASRNTCRRQDFCVVRMCVEPNFSTKQDVKQVLWERDANKSFKSIVKRPKGSRTLCIFTHNHVLVSSPQVCISNARAFPLTSTSFLGFYNSNDFWQRTIFSNSSIHMQNSL